MAKGEFYFLVERDGNGGFVGDAARFFSCRSHGKTLDELMSNMHKTIESCLRNDNQDNLSEISGVYKIRVICESQATDGNFYVLVKDDGEGGYIGIAPELKGCLSHGLTLEELMSNMEEVISLCLEGGEEALNRCFLGVQKVAI
jgi:predicted RNase H-like HicB family nuclease